MLRVRVPSGVSVNRDEETFLLESIPEQAWNLVLDGAAKFDVVKALRMYSKSDPGLMFAAQMADRMREMLGSR
jgi:hypothetical protein